MPTDLAAPTCGPLDQADLDALLARLTADTETSIGFPGATDFDYRHSLHCWRSCSTTSATRTSTASTHAHQAPEREAVEIVADLLRAPADDRWGYVTSGATEGNEHALHLARHPVPGRASSTTRSPRTTASPSASTDSRMRSLAIRADRRGEIDYLDLAGQIGLAGTGPAIVVANVGTAMHEAIDDVRRDPRTPRRPRDGPALDPRRRRAVRHPARPARPAGAARVRLRRRRRLGHRVRAQVPRLAVPCGVWWCATACAPTARRAATYTGSPDTTLANSRSGFAALRLWYALHQYGLRGSAARPRLPGPRRVHLPASSSTSAWKPAAPARVHRRARHPTAGRHQEVVLTRRGGSAATSS